MKNVFKIAIRNLLRYKRRTLMTSLLIVIGIVLVIVFSGVSVSFKRMMIGSITDSMLGHLQIHKKGYVSSIDNLPLHLNMNEKNIKPLETLFKKHADIIEESRIHEETSDAIVIEGRGGIRRGQRMRRRGGLPNCRGPP